jgi:hypothetical protein
MKRLMSQYANENWNSPTTCGVPFQYQTLSKSVKLFLRWNMRSYLIFQVCCEHTRSSKCVANIHDFPSVFRTYTILQVCCEHARSSKSVAIRHDLSSVLRTYTIFYVCCEQARSSKCAANIHDLPSVLRKYAIFQSVLRTYTIFQVCCEHARSSTYAANIRDLPSVLSFYVLHAKNTWKLWRAIRASIHYEIDIFPQLLSFEFSSFSFCLRRHFIHLIFCFHSFSSPFTLSYSHSSLHALVFAFSYF